MIRGAVYRVDLGDAKRGHQQRGKRFGLVLSPCSMPWTSARPAVLRPSWEINGRPTRPLVDQIRGVDIRFVYGDPVHYLNHDELAEIEHAVRRYLGL